MLDLGPWPFASLTTFAFPAVPFRLAASASASMKIHLIVSRLGISGIPSDQNLSPCFESLAVFTNLLFDLIYTVLY